MLAVGLYGKNVEDVLSVQSPFIKTRFLNKPIPADKLNTLLSRGPGSTGYTLLEKPVVFDKTLSAISLERLLKAKFTVPDEIKLLCLKRMFL
ncbi:hypothetical protein D3C80_1700450 [compost metagenome]